MPIKPWIEGPLELLKHGLEHLLLKSDFDARIAMISIDNAVELMIKTYLGLPSRITGIEGLSRRRYQEISESFPSLLDGFEKFASDKIVGIELGDIEWFHRIRNRLYHEGNGITVERGKVEGYAEIAKILFSNLFSLDVETLIEEMPQSLVGEFFSKWAKLEQELVRLTAKYLPVCKNKSLPISTLAEGLKQANILPASFFQQLNSTRQFRNQTVHGLTFPSASDLQHHNATVRNLLEIAGKF
ncbi:MAG: hypothetical protein HXS54_07835 [Theionarchaea archaeon]|nr:hypothetical protein [Theionarchaea archaeon]